MRQYFFTIRADSLDPDVAERAVMLSDDAAALAYACEMAQELMQKMDCVDLSLLVKVRDETRAMVLSIPCFAACA